jgi:hypothetical protein
MRFPSFSRFFHKRSQSDSNLYKRTQPGPTLPPRPVSVTFSNGMVLADYTQHSLLSDFLSGIPVTPLAVNTGTGNGIPQPTSSSTVSSATHASSSQLSAASQPVVIDVLTRRIQDLEDVVRSHEAAADPQRVAGLEHALEATRQSSRDLEQDNAALVQQLKGVRAELLVAESELQSLRADNTRLVTLLDVPVLKDIVGRVHAGEDPEEALVDAIKTAMDEHGGTWRQLLEPVTGARSPEDYIAQVRCTLRARRESRDWRLRAGFWKESAKEDGRHGNTVTPSASQLSDIVEAGSTGVQRKSGLHTLSRLWETSVPLSGVHEVQVNLTEPPLQAAISDVPFLSTATQSAPVTSMPTDEFPERTSTAPAASEPPADPSALVMHEAAAESVAELLPKSESDMSIEPELCTSVLTPLAAAPYASLPPLASVVFRDSYSIRSLTSKSWHEGAAAVLAPSLSSLSQSSRRSNRSARVITPPRVKAVVVHTFEVDNKQPAGFSKFARNSAPGKPVIELQAMPTVAYREEDDTLEIPGSDFSSTSWDLLSSVIGKSFSYTSPGWSVSASPPREPRANTPPPPHVPPADPIHQPTLNSPPLSTDVSQPTRDANVQPSPQTTPVKKSRLPLPTAMQRVRTALPAARLVRRFSRQISRPVLRDSTNAAAVGDAAPVPAPVAKAKAKTRVDASDAREKAMVVGPEKEKSHGKDKAGLRKAMDVTRLGVRGVQPPKVGPSKAVSVEEKENPGRGRRPTVLGRGESPRKKSKLSG